MDYTTYSWDHRNRLTSVVDYDANGTVSDVDDVVTQSVAYQYDVYNQLIGREVDTDGATGSTPLEKTVYVYHDGQVVLQFDDAGTGDLTSSDLSHRYLWGEAVDQLLADEQVDWSDTDADGDILWPLTDHLGSVRDIADSTGAVLNHIVYDAFGNVISETAPSVDIEFGYTARQFDDATGLQNNLNRWYDPIVGRWVSLDPIGFNAGDTNLYRYVGNGSVNFVDPTGFFAAGAKGNFSGAGSAVSGVNAASIYNFGSYGIVGTNGHVGSNSDFINVGFTDYSANVQTVSPQTSLGYLGEIFSGIGQGLFDGAKGLVEGQIALQNHQLDTLGDVWRGDMQGAVERQGDFLAGWFSESSFRDLAETAMFLDSYKKGQLLTVTPPQQILNDRKEFLTNIDEFIQSWNSSDSFGNGKKFAPLGDTVVETVASLPFGGIGRGASSARAASGLDDIARVSDDLIFGQRTLSAAQTPFERLVESEVIDAMQRQFPTSESWELMSISKPHAISTPDPSLGTSQARYQARFYDHVDESYIDISINYDSEMNMFGIIKQSIWKKITMNFDDEVDNLIENRNFEVARTRAIELLSKDVPNNTVIGQFLTADDQWRLEFFRNLATEHPNEIDITLAFITELNRQHRGDIAFHVCCKALKMFDHPKSQFLIRRARLSSALQSGKFENIIEDSRYLRHSSASGSDRVWNSVLKEITSAKGDNLLLPLMHLVLESWLSECEKSLLKMKTEQLKQLELCIKQL